MSHLPRRSLRRTALLVSMLPALSLAAGCKSGDTSAATDSASAAIGVRTAVAVARPFTEKVGAIGSVVGRPGHVASLGAPGPTRVIRVAVAVGTRVAPGQVLVELDQALFQAALRSAEARLSAAERAFERAQRLATEGIIPRKDVETAQTDLAVARTELVTARRASELSILRSPIAGVVTRLNAALGAPVDVSQVLVEVADPSALDVLLGVTSNEARRVRPGADVTLAAGQRASGEPLGIGKVADVAATVDTLTRSVSVRVNIPSARRPLRIGETVYGQIALETRPDAIVVPEEAIVPEGEGFKVFVVDDQSIAHQRPVTVGARADSLVEILEGLKAGERVVTYGAYGVVDSAKVVPLGGAPKPGASPTADTANKQDVGKGAAKPAAKAGDAAPGEKQK